MQASLDFDVYTKNETTKPPFAKVCYLTDTQNSDYGIISSHFSFVFFNYKIDKLLAEYSLLEDNWDDDNALAPSPEAIKRAKNLTMWLSRFLQPIYHAAPGPNGEIMLDIRNQGNTKSIEFIFYKERSVVVFFPETGTPKQSDYSFMKIREYLKWINS